MLKLVDFSKVRGFNYQPSYGSTSFENWRYFKPEVVELELRRGKHYFPKINTIRLWLSWDAYIRDPEAFNASFEKTLDILDSLDLKAIPTLFNRWHSGSVDCGGIYIDHFVPGWSWMERNTTKFDRYLEDVVGGHRRDERIIAWDICNEPFGYNRKPEEGSSLKEVQDAEFNWLRSIYERGKQLCEHIPFGIGIHTGTTLEYIDPISDVFMVHPYFVCHVDGEGEEDKAKIEKQLTRLDHYVEYARSSGKPLVATETCWGSLDDGWRVTNMKFNLEQLVKRDIGFLAHLLHHTLVADGHRPEFGPVSKNRLPGTPGTMAFIEHDGKLRQGHGVFNDYC